MTQIELKKKDFGSNEKVLEAVKTILELLSDDLINDKRIINTHKECVQILITSC